MTDGKPSLDPVRLMIVDDHPVVRAGLVTLLSQKSHLQVVAEASAGQHAIDVFDATEVDVCMIDLSLPDMDGIEVIRVLSQKTPRRNFIVLSIFGRPEDIYRAFQSGANGYLLKDSKPDELFE